MKLTISKAVSIGLMLFLLAAVVPCVAAESGNAPTEKTFAAPHGLKVSIKLIGPYGEPADLQIICLFKHKAGGDTYQGAAKIPTSICMGCFLRYEIAVSLLGNWEKPSFSHHPAIQFRPSVS